MARQPRRTFTLLDAIVLVASSAIGFAWVRSNWDFADFEWPEIWTNETPEMLAPLLATWTVAIVALRLVPPRPLLRRLVLQPGAAACGSVAFGFTIECLSYFGFSLARAHRIPWYLFRAGGGAGPELISNAIAGAPYHFLVMSVWGLLILSRRFRPEPSWIDRVGRAIGLSWLLLALWRWSNYAIEMWRG